MQPLRGFFKLLAVMIMITVISLPVAVCVHEGTHYLIYTFEGIPVTSFHVLDAESHRNGCYGFVTTTKESQYGAVVHEGIAYLTGYLCVTMILLFFLLLPLKRFTFRQLHAIGVQRKPYACVHSTHGKIHNIP